LTDALTAIASIKAKGKLPLMDTAPLVGLSPQSAIIADFRRVPMAFLQLRMLWIAARIY
jgi:hypothetical protein